jgi:hypothetical protein
MSEPSHPATCATTLCSGRIRPIEGNSFRDRGFEWNVCLQVTLIKVIRDSVFGRAGLARPLTHFGRVHYALAARWCAWAASRPRLRHRCKSGYRLCARAWAIKAPILRRAQDSPNSLSSSGAVPSLRNAQQDRFGDGPGGHIQGDRTCTYHQMPTASSCTVQRGGRSIR